MAWMAVAQMAVAATAAVVEGYNKGQQLDAESRIAEQNRDLAFKQAYSKEDQQRRQNRYALGRQAAAFGENNVMIEGSTARVAGQSAASAELDALNIRYGGILKAHGHEQERIFARDAAKRSRRMAWFNAGAAAFGAGASSGAFSPKPTTGLSAGGGNYGLGGGDIDNLRDRWGY